MTGTIESDKNAHLHLPTQEDRDRADKVFQQVLKDGPQERNGKGKFVKGAAVVSTAAAAAAMFAGCTPGIVQPSEMPSQSAITIDPNTGEPIFTPTTSSTTEVTPSPTPELDQQKEAQEKLNQQIQDFLNFEGDFSEENMAKTARLFYDENEKPMKFGCYRDDELEAAGWLFDTYEKNGENWLLVGFDGKDGNRFVTLAKFDTKVNTEAGFGMGVIRWKGYGKNSGFETQKKLKTNQEITNFLESIENNPIRLNFPPGYIPEGKNFNRWTDLINQVFVEVADNGFTKIQRWYPESISPGTKLVRIENVEAVDQISSDDIPEFANVKFIKQKQ